MFSNSADSSTLDSEEEGEILYLSTNDKKRQAHIISEQKRRDAIKKGYDELIELLKSVEESNLSHQNLGPNNLLLIGLDENVHKLSKAGLLYKTQEYIQSLQAHVKQQQTETELLQREIGALDIMKQNYQAMLNHQNNKTNQSLHDGMQSSFSSENSLFAQPGFATKPEFILTKDQAENYAKNREIKSQIFTMIMDFLFLTFNASLVTTSFNDLIKSVTTWLEEYCKPQNLREITLRILRQVNPKLPE